MPDLSHMTLTFDDEFTDRSISLTGSGTTWADSRNEFRSGSTDVGFGSSTFVDPKAGYDPFNVSNGVLTITAVPNTTVPSASTPWESGLITTQNTFSQTYGYFEMRADLSSTVGAWDAFWLLPDKSASTTTSGGQEIDVVEHYGDDDSAVYSTIHTTDPLPVGGTWQNNYQVVSTEANPTGFHNYGLMWTAETLSFYLDGNLVGTKPTPSDMHGPMYLLADLATQSSGANTANPDGPPIQTQIDYIRAYAFTNSPQTLPDTVYSAVTYTLPSTVHNLVLDGNASINGTGNSLANTITGNSGANIINGGAGADTMVGGAGNDIYYVDNASDHVIEAIGGGSDRVATSLSYTLPAGQEIKRLTTTSFTGIDKINLTGNEFNNLIQGNAGANVLDGGLGNDVLTGFSGADTFLFDTALGKTNIDWITDFANSTNAVHDKIDLSHAIFSTLSTGAPAATAFVDIGVAGAVETGVDHLIYNHNTGGLYYDDDGSGHDAAILFAVFSNHVALSAADFMIT